MEADTNESRFAVLHYSWPNYWELQEDIFDNPDQALERFNEVVNELRQSVVGNFLVDIRRLNEILTVFVVKHQRMLMLARGPFDTQYSLGKSRSKSTVVIDAPEWTEMSRRYLISEEEALGALRRWLDTGETSTEIKWTDEQFIDD